MAELAGMGGWLMETVDNSPAALRRQLWEILGTMNICQTPYSVNTGNY